MRMTPGQAQEAIQAAPNPLTVKLALAALLVSAMSGLISAVTAWLTLFRRGNLKMIRPLMVGFISRGRPKVVIRTTLFSSARQGNVVERLFVRLAHNGTSTQTLHLWGFGDSPTKFGAGLFVNQEGRPFTHHFLPSNDKRFSFLPGDTTVTVLAKVVNRKTDVLLFSDTFKLDDQQAGVANDSRSGLVFNLEPETGRYYPSIEQVTVEESADVSGPEQLTIELQATDQNVLIFDRDTRAHLHYKIRIKNFGSVPMTPRTLRLTFKAYGPPEFSSEVENVDVPAQFRELPTGAEQVIEYPLPLVRLHDARAPSAVRISIAGEVFVVSPAWEGVKSQYISSFNWGTVLDNRPGPKQV